MGTPEKKFDSLVATPGGSKFYSIDKQLNPAIDNTQSVSASQPFFFSRPRQLSMRDKTMTSRCGCRDLRPGANYMHQPMETKFFIFQLCLGMGLLQYILHYQRRKKKTL